jgi:hypothetical protein
MNTKLERDWMNAITQIGCIVCLLWEGVPGTPGAVHHILRGGRRISHLDTICLCDPGHHQNSPTPSKVSRHPNKAAFEKRYATEEYLLWRTRQLVEQRFGLYIGVDIDAIYHTWGKRHV